MVDEQLTIEDEWTDSADNEPHGYTADYEADRAAHEADEAAREWAQALATEEKGDEQC